MTIGEKKEFAELYWLTQVYGQVSSMDLQRLGQLGKKLTDDEAERLSDLMEVDLDEEKYRPTEKQILRTIKS